MIDLDLNGEEPQHVERLTPIMDTDVTGHVNWTPGLLDYDATKMYRGKQLTSEELNKLLLKQIYQGNYNADSLKEFFDNQLPEAITNHFRTAYDLTSNYIKIFLSTDWGEQDEDGYYNIEIPASEHGFEIDESEDVLERMNIQVSVYLYKDGEFYEVPQYHIDDENKVTIYTDDNTAIGFVVIQDNNKAISFTEGTITISQVTGLSSKLDGYNARITANEGNIGGIRSGSLAAGHATLADEATHATDADNAENLTTKIRNISLDKIFETGSRNVKQATRALRLSELNANDSSETYVEAGSSTRPVYFSGGVPVAITGALGNDITGNADTATNVTTKINDKDITDIFESDGVTAKKATKDDLGRTIKETYTTGLVLTRENLTVSILLPPSDTNNATNAANQIANAIAAGSSSGDYKYIDFFEMSPQTITVPAFVTRSIAGSNLRLMNASTVKQITGPNRYDRKFVFVKISDLDVNNYPKVCTFTSSTYNYGFDRNMAFRAEVNGVVQTATLGGQTYVRYNLTDGGYDYNTNAYVLVEFLA